jgi:flavin reductase (DIM6/NTAB) family NADH-FMN oxidoreductase RutF
MKRSEISFDKFSAPVFKSWGSDWFLLTSGCFKSGKFNTMTVAWGSFGVMWQKPFAMVVVRPSRHTYAFMEKFETFTLSAFPSEFKKVLNFCGVKSGKDMDKIKEAGITPIPSLKVEAPGFDEAELIIECRKNYFDDFRPKHFMDASIEGNYPGRDYHRVYFGEIVAISGVGKYLDEK